MTIDGHDVVVRWLQYKDHAAVLDLLTACFRAEEWTAKDLAAFMSKTVPHTNVAKVVAGVTSGKRDPIYGLFFYSIEPGGACRVRRLAVWHDYRRMGLGSMALASVIGPQSLFRSARRFSVDLSKSRLQTSGRAFLEANGFRLEGDPAKMLFVFDKPAF